MKTIIAIILGLTISLSAYSQAPLIQWQKDFGGSNSESATSIQQTTDGGYIIAGPSQSNDSEVTGNHGASDYWIVKINDTGGIQWEQSFGGNGDDNAYSVKQTLDGGYIVAGGSSTNSISGDVTCNIEEWEYWVVKLSDTGSIEWTGCYGDPSSATSFTKAYAINLTADSGYMLIGQSNENGGEVTGNHGNADYWVIHISSTGALLWEKSYGGSQLDVGESIQQTSDGGYIAAGITNSNDSEVTGNHGGSDYWVIKLDDTGGLQWQKCFGGSGDDLGESVQQTYDGGYIVAGSSNSIDGQVTGNHGGYDYWVIKLDDTGGVQWQTSLGGAGDEDCYSIQQTIDSGYIVAGASDSSSGEVTGTHGQNDFWVVKISKYGNLQWEKALGGSAVDVAASIQQTSDTGFIVAGGTSSTDGDITKNFGIEDFWVVKLSSMCILDSPVIINSGSTLSTSGSYNTYQWYFNGAPIAGATNATYTANSDGAYALSVSDTTGCIGNSRSDTLSNVGINTIFNNSMITLMPNPTSGIINIKGTGLVTISVYNVLGQLMKETQNADNISISAYTL